MALLDQITADVAAAKAVDALIVARLIDVGQQLKDALAQLQAMGGNITPALATLSADLESSNASLQAALAATDPPAPPAPAAVNKAPEEVVLVAADIASE